MEHFFVTDLAAKYRELVCTESPTPQNQFTSKDIMPGITWGQKSF